MHSVFLKKADLLEPKLIFKNIPVVRFGHIQPIDCWDGYCFVQDGADRCMQQGDSICLDFGAHCTGYVSFTLSAPKKYPDAPTRLRFKFAETLYELGTPFEEYQGGLSPAWLQEEIFVADEPDTYTLRRRYSFRYAKVTVETANVPVLLTDISVRACTSADWTKLKTANIPDSLKMLDKIGCNTLSECMQRVFEDGPKRDRRLWIGDLRLQALVNYVTFDNVDLVRRCLYLFAGHTKEKRYTPRCVFMNNRLTIPDAEIFVDYALMFCLILCDYYGYTGDGGFVDELFPIAKEQLTLALAGVNDDGIVQMIPVDGNWAFIDWCEGLQRRTAMQGVIIYTLNHMIALCDQTGRSGLAAQYRQISETMKIASRRYLYDEEKQAFINAFDEKQYSVHSQVWMVLAGVLDREEGQALMKKVLSAQDIIRPVTPYMHHYVVEALMAVDMKEEALAYIQNYWGQMLTLGADTYWEVFVPGEPDVSPYGNRIINSACHAWSCSPSYFIRKYFTSGADSQKV